MAHMEWVYGKTLDNMKRIFEDINILWSAIAHVLEFGMTNVAVNEAFKTHFLLFLNLYGQRIQ